jgi:hypothetical protein
MVSDTVAPAPLEVPKMLANEVKLKVHHSAAKTGQEAEVKRETSP